MVFPRVISSNPRYFPEDESWWIQSFGLNSLIPYANHGAGIFTQMLVNIPYMEHVGMVLFMVCRPLSRYQGDGIHSPLIHWYFRRLFLLFYHDLNHVNPGWINPVYGCFNWEGTIKKYEIAALWGIPPNESTMVFLNPEMTLYGFHYLVSNYN